MLTLDAVAVNCFRQLVNKYTVVMKVMDDAEVTAHSIIHHSIDAPRLCFQDEKGDILAAFPWDDVVGVFLKGSVVPDGQEAE